MRRLICSLCCSLWIGLAQAESPRAAMALVMSSPEPDSSPAAIFTPATVVLTATVAATAAPAPITLYTATWCGYCRRLKARLAAAHLSYVEYDVEQSEQGRRYAQSTEYAGVPLTVVGESEVVGDDLDALRELLTQGGYAAHSL
jgi:glutaredoxin